jgi:aminoglycoside phosphotransferase (APT) family kinase protein
MDPDSDDARAAADALRRMGLLAPGEVDVRITPLAGGVSSLIVRADTIRGLICVKRALPQLKVAAHWEAPVERNRAEVAWMKLAMLIVPGGVPEVLGEDAQSFSYAMGYLDPSDYPVWKTQLLAGHADVETARAVGRNLVAIHAATADDAALAREFANDESFHALRLDPYFVAAARANPDCADALHALVQTTAHTKRALVHGDISPKNILVGANGPVLLDAECAWYGDPAFDLAFCLNHLLLKTVWRPASAGGYLRCFDALAESYMGGVWWEPPSALEARAAALLAGLLLARIDGKSPVEYITRDGDKERVRHFAVALLKTPAQLLSDIRQRWSLSSP